MPLSVAFWTDELAAAPVPAFSHNARLVSALGGGASLSTARIVGCVSSDIGLTLALLAPLGTAGAARAGSLGRAVMLLGVEHAVQAVASPRTLETIEDRAAREGAARVVARASFAAFAAREWGTAAGDPAPEELYLAAMLRHAPEYALWTVAPILASRLEHARREEQTTSAAPEADLLGCRLDALVHALAARWPLPPLVSGSLLGTEPDPSGGETETPIEPDARRRLCVDLAYRISGAGYLGWDHPQTTGALRRLGGYLRRGDDAVSSGAHALAAKSARLLAAHGGPAASALGPAHALLLDPNGSAGTLRRGIDPILVPALGPTPGGSAPAPPSKAGARRRTTIPDPPSRCAAVLDGFTSGGGAVATLFQGLAAGMTVDLDLDRALFAIITPDRKRLAGRFCSPPGCRGLLAAFDYPVDDGSLFARLLARRASVWLRAENRARIAPLLPAAFSDLGVESFFAMSVFSGRRAVGLFYADATPAARLDQDRFRRFQSVCVRAGEALARAASKGTRAA